MKITLLKNEKEENLNSNSSLQHKTDRQFLTLLKKNLISEEELEKAINISYLKFIDIAEYLINSKMIGKVELLEAIASSHNVDYIDCNRDYTPPIELLQYLELDEPFKLMEAKCFVPYKVIDNQLIILSNSPASLVGELALDKIITGIEYQISLAIESDIHNLIKNLYNRLATASNGSIGISNPTKLVSDIYNESKDSILERVAKAKSILGNNDILVEAMALDKISKMVIDRNITAIHLEASKESEPLLIRLRINGQCINYRTIPVSFKERFINYIKDESGLSKSRAGVISQGELLVNLVDNRKIKYKVTVVPTSSESEDVILDRIQEVELTPINRLGMSHNQLSLLESNLQSSKGLIVAAGADRSNATTTLYSMFNHVINSSKKVWNLETPAKFSHRDVKNIFLKDNNENAKKEALDILTGSDADIILAGEIQGEQLLNSLINVAESGKLCFALIKAENSIEAVVELTKEAKDKLRLSNILKLVVSQQVIPQLCNHCKESYRPTYYDIQSLIKSYGENLWVELQVNIPTLTLFRAVGCRRCNSSGYIGSVGVYELLGNNSTIKEIIRGNGRAVDLRPAALLNGMRTIRQTVVMHVLAGNISVDFLRTFNCAI
ncbi:MAG: GspE/PulE family protein [Nitrospinota bacterium]